MKRTFEGLLFGLMTITLASHAGFAQEISGGDAEDAAAKATHVEEDWIVLVRNPDPDTCAPQVVNFMAPDSSDTSYGMFEINHCSSPSFLPGGFQVQAYKSDVLVHRRNAAKQQVLSRGYDKFTYTTVMKIENGMLKYQLKNGRSKTWGRFAEDRDDLCAVHATDKTTLAGYDPTHSVKNSSVNVGAHRVELMTQKETRWYAADGTLLKRDTTERYPHRYAETIQDVTFEEYMANLDSLYTWEITE